MADKKEAGEGGGRARKEKPMSDKKRFGYLRIRYAELKKESQAVKTEMTELRKKLGASKKGGAGAEDDDED